MSVVSNTSHPKRNNRLVGICFVCLLFWCPSLMAQVNIFTGETMKQMQLESGVYNSICTGSNLPFWQYGFAYGSDSVSLRLSHKAYHAFVFGSLQQGRKSGEFFINKGMAHARIIQGLTPHLLFESFVQKQFNESILLSDRNLIGSGVRFASHPGNSKFNLYLGIGAMWEHERISDKERGAITTRIVRATNYINWTGQLYERITTSATGYYQVYVRRFQDYRILFEGSITFRLTTKLSFPLRVNFRYDSEPPTSIRKHDVEIFNGLRYTF